ncbi:MAG: hypothetical protein ACI4PC_03840 [Oscillospiraceae bacterium]
MPNLDEWEKQMKKNPRAGKMMETAAMSQEGRRIMQSVDAAAVEKAAREGDTAALKSILSQVLSSPDGKALAQKLQETMKQE